jgi:hypothetical protein
VECGHDEIDADDIVPPPPDFTAKFALGRVVENHRGRFDVFSNVIEAPTTNNLAIAEDSLTASHLSVKQLGPDGIPLSFSAEGTANGGQEHIRHIDDPYATRRYNL